MELCVFGVMCNMLHNSCHFSLSILQGEVDCSIENLGQVDFSMLSHELQTTIRVSKKLY